MIHVRYDPQPRAPGVVYSWHALALCGFPACSEVRVPSALTSSLGLSCVPRELLTLGMYFHFEAIQPAPKVAYPRNAPSRRGFLASFEDFVPAECTFGLELSRTPRGE